MPRVLASLSKRQTQ